MAFSQSELNQYARHFPLPNFGLEGQAKLKASKVLCIGAGGLGSPVLLYLAAAGVGTIGIIDPDVVEQSNLQRQIIHDTEELGFPKVQSAKDRLTALNPNIEIVTYETTFDVDNARELVRQYDLVIDGCDNFPTRYLSNDACFLEKKPNIYGSIYQFEGQCSVFAPHLEGACYRCLYPTPPDSGQIPNCAEGGVLGVLPGVIGSLQALEAIKLITDIGEPLLNKLLSFDALSSQFMTFKYKRNKDCPLCGTNPSITHLEKVELSCNHKALAVQTINVKELSKLMASESIKIIDVRENFELDICQIENSLHIPLSQLNTQLNLVDPEENYYLLCHHGSRSHTACEILIEHGITRVTNIEGGIHAWAIEVDPSIATY